MDGRMHNYILVSFSRDLGRSSARLLALHVKDQRLGFPAGPSGAPMKEAQTTRLASCLYGIWISISNLRRHI